MQIKNCPFCSSPQIYQTRGKIVYRTGEIFDRPELFCDSCKANVYFEDSSSKGIDEEADYKVLENLLIKSWNDRP